MSSDQNQTEKKTCDKEAIKSFSVLIGTSPEKDIPGSQLGQQK
jgi:hypothetical protein